ncbi:hypothetical protein [Paraburkholderia sp. PGU19]|nr:hypothetical protein [Paraburkholderia sp. PGU19]
MSIQHGQPDELNGQAVAADEITYEIVDLATTAARAPLQLGAQGA